MTKRKRTEWGEVGAMPGEIPDAVRTKPSALTITDDVAAVAMAPIAQRLAELEAQARACIVTSDAEASRATDLAKQLRLADKQLDAIRKSIVQPLNDHVKNMNAKFKPAAERIEQAQAAVDAELRKWTAEQQRIERERQARIAEEEAKRLKALEARAARATRPETLAKLEAEAGLVRAEAAGALVAGAGVIGAVGQSAKATTRKRLVCEIADQALVPLELLSLDTAEALRRYRAGEPVPGVRYEEVDELVVR